MNLLKRFWLHAETEEERLFRLVGKEDICPDCGGKGFYEGPRGGISVNIFCKNQECRSGFNIAHFSRTVGFCDRIGKGDLSYYPK